MPLLAHIEVGLDHSDEDHDVLARATLAGDCAAVNARIDEILRSSTVGNILRDGLRVALLGRPNVGKSSLLNALLKEDRAIVTPIAGTTRDTLEESVDWDGIPVVLTDTAGLRDDAQEAVERAGITRARQAIERSDVAVVLFDHSQPLTDDDRRIVDDIQTMPHLWVANKSDLPAGWPLEQLSGWNGNAAVISVSARTGEGLDDLVRAVKSQALGGAGSAGDAQWMLNLRHRAALERAKESLVRAARAADGDLFEECVALELKAALDALGEIIGETTTDDLLGEIFSTFCVGK